MQAVSPTCPRLPAFETHTHHSIRSSRRHHQHSYVAHNVVDSSLQRAHVTTSHLATVAGTVELFSVLLLCNLGKNSGLSNMCNTIDTRALSTQVSGIETARQVWHLPQNSNRRSLYRSTCARPEVNLPYGLSSKICYRLSVDRPSGMHVRFVHMPW